MLIYVLICGFSASMQFHNAEFPCKSNMTQQFFISFKMLRSHGYVSMPKTAFW